MPTVAQTLEDVGDGRYQFWMLILTGSVFMGEAVEVLLLSFLQGELQDDWGLTQSQSNTITSMVFVGEILGAVFFGWLSDNAGRRKSFLLCTLTVFVFGLCSAFAGGYGSMLWLRMMVGFGVGGFIVPYDLLAEVVTSKGRFTYLLYLNGFWTIGSVLTAVLAWIFIPSMGWRAFLVASCIPSLVVLIAAYPTLPESPFWLSTQGRHEEAAEVLQNIANINGKSTIVTVQGDDQQCVSSVKELVSPEYRVMTSAIWGLWFFFTFAYYGTIILTPALLFEDSDDAYAEVFFSSAMEVVGIIILYFVSKCVGRVPMLRLFFLCAAASFLLLAFFPSTELFTLTLARVMCFNASVVVWTYTTEIYPTVIRSMGHSAASLVGKMGAILAPWVANGTLTAGDGAIGWTFGSVMLIAFGLAFVIKKETKDAILADFKLGGADPVSATSYGTGDSA